jgi:hypothetical protein
LRVNEEAKQETGKKKAVSRTLKMEAHVPPKHQLPFTGLHCILAQKVQLFSHSYADLKSNHIIQMIYLEKL